MSRSYTSFPPSAFMACGGTALPLKVKCDVLFEARMSFEASDACIKTKKWKNCLEYVLGGKGKQSMMEMIALWDMAPCSLVVVDRSAYYIRHQGDFPETSVYTHYTAQYPRRLWFSYYRRENLVFHAVLDKLQDGIYLCYRDTNLGVNSLVWKLCHSDTWH
jgi:hypothetical protein